ncbi:MAG: hypothetical protein ABI234_13005 [Ktedonobacteraceae bacterium]
MSQHEFEPRQQQSDEEIYQPQYPYTWSGQDQREGMPRDEPHGNYYNTQESQYKVSNAAQVPWWARAQPQQRSPLVFVTIVIIAVFFVFVIGGLGILSVILGGLFHILGVILGALFALLIFILLVIFLILAVIRRAFRRAFGASWTSGSRDWRSQRRMTRRAARRSWRGW